MYVIQLTIPHAHAKNQVSSSIFGAQIGLNFDKSAQLKFLKSISKKTILHREKLMAPL